MKWYTRQGAHIDRTACPWLITRFIDPAAEFVFVPGDTDPAMIAGHTFDMRGAEFSHEGTKCTFQVMLARHRLTDDPALAELGRIIRDADVPPRRGRRPEAAGVVALVSGLQRTVPDDQEKLRVTTALYEALYAYCQAKVANQLGHHGPPRPGLSYRRRMELHLAEQEPGPAQDGSEREGHRPSGSAESE